MGRRNGFVLLPGMCFAVFPLHENQASLPLFKTSRICSRQTDRALLLLFFMFLSYSARVDSAINLADSLVLGRQLLEQSTHYFSQYAVICYNI